MLAALAVLAAIAVVPARARASEPVLYVGDSLGVGTVQQLRSNSQGREALVILTARAAFSLVDGSRRGSNSIPSGRQNLEWRDDVSNPA